MSEYEIVGHDLLVDGEPGGIFVRAKGRNVIFETKAGGVASYATNFPEDAVLRFARVFPGDRRPSVIVSRGGR